MPNTLPLQLQLDRGLWVVSQLSAHEPPAAASSDAPLAMAGGSTVEWLATLSMLRLDPPIGGKDFAPHSGVTRRLLSPLELDDPTPQQSFVVGGYLEAPPLHTLRTLHALHTLHALVGGRSLEVLQELHALLRTRRTRHTTFYHVAGAAGGAGLRRRLLLGRSARAAGVCNGM